MLRMIRRRRRKRRSKRMDKIKELKELTSHISIKCSLLNTKLDDKKTQRFYTVVHRRM